MCVIKRNPWVVGLGVLLTVLVVYGGHARADVTTDQSGSVIIFPKVIADGTRDTLIQIANKGNTFVSAHCIYINNIGTCTVTGETCNLDSDCEEITGGSNTCSHACDEVDFDIDLTGQQPTFWDVALGRTVDPTDELSGFDPGNIVGRGTTFRGELICVETDGDVPASGNHLTGQACIFGNGVSNAFVADYNGITISAGSQDSASTDLNLNNTEYNACPASLLMNHYADGAVDSFTGATVNTELTLIPCTQDILHMQGLGLRPHASVTLDVYDEVESKLSKDAVQIDCLLNESLGDIDPIFTASSGAGVNRKTRIFPSSATGMVCLTGDQDKIGVTCTADTDCCDDGTTSCILTSDSGTLLGCRLSSGVLGVAEEFQTNSNGTGNDVFNLHTEGSRPGDIIVLPTTSTGP